jgi:hypothetical protein
MSKAPLDAEPQKEGRQEFHSSSLDVTARDGVVEHDGTDAWPRMRPLKQMRGFLRGIDTSVSRDEDRV